MPMEARGCASAISHFASRTWPGHRDKDGQSRRGKSFRPTRPDRRFPRLPRTKTIFLAPHHVSFRFPSVCPKTKQSSYPLAMFLPYSGVFIPMKIIVLPSHRVSFLFQGLDPIPNENHLPTPSVSPHDVSFLFLGDLLPTKVIIQPLTMSSFYSWVFIPMKTIFQPPQHVFLLLPDVCSQ